MDAYMRFASGSHRLGLIFWTALFLLVPLALYTLYVLKRRPEINEYLSRSLKLVADRLETILANTSRNVANLNDQLKRASAERQAAEHLVCTFVDYQQYVGLVEPKSCREIVRKALPERLQLQLTGGEKNSEKALVLRVRFDQILRDLPLDREFDYILIADPQGRVAHEAAVTPAWEHRRELHFSNISELSDRTAGAISLKLLTSASRLFAVRLGGREYQMFSHPVRIGFSGQRPPETWILCGFIASSNVASEALMMPSTIILILILLVVFGILPWPFVKLALMGKRERFEFTDGYLLLFSTSAVLLLLTVLVLDVDNYWRESQTEGTLRKLADLVESNMVDELRKMRDQLVVYDRLVVGADNSAYDRRKTPCLVSDLLAQPRTENKCPIPPRPSYTNLKHVFFAGPDGWEFAKATVRASNTSMISVASRDYFQRAIKDRLFRLRDSGRAEADNRPFAVQAIRSLTTGEQETVLSIRSGMNKVPGAPDTGGSSIVAAISEEVPWTDALILPAGCGFAVFSSDGNIVYHSDDRRAIDANIFDHVDRSRRLRAAVLSRTKRFFHSDYLTRPHDLYVLPLARVEGAGWFLLTFRDSQILGTLNTEAVAGAVTLAIVSIFLFQLAPSLLWILVRGRRISWLWPDQDKYWRYRGLSLVNLGAVLVMGLLVLFAEGKILLISCFLVPAGALLLMVTTYCLPVTDREKSHASPETHLRHTLRWHIAAAVLVWVLTSILPGIGFFRFAWTEQVTAYARYDELHRQELLTARRHAVEDAYRLIRIDQRDRFLNGWRTRLVGAADIVSGLSPRLDPPAENAWFYSGIREFMQRYKPIYNEVSTAFRYQPTDHSIADWAGLDFRIGLVTSVSLMVLLVLVILWVRYSASHIFFGSIGPAAKSASTPSGSELDEELRRRWRCSGEQEKLALVHLVEEGVVNPKQEETVRKLVADGLLVRDPELRPSTASFRDFIRGQVDRSKIAEWERSDPGLRWSEVRWAIGIILVSIAALLFLTQRGLFDATTGFVSAIAVIAPALLRVANFLGNVGKAGDHS